MSTGEITVIEAWIVYMDIFGFSALVQSEDAEVIAARLREGHEQILDVIKGSDSPIHFRIISDCVFVIYEVPSAPHHSKVLQKCIEHIEVIMSRFIALELPVRGGIASGTVYLGNNILVGKPVVNAVKYEAMIPAPSILLPLAEMGRLRPAEMPACVRLIPIKDDGLISGALIFPRPIDPLVELARQRRDTLAVRGPFSVAKVWDDAIHYLSSTSELRL